ncbi:pre-mRNA-processing factor 17 isoform X2 [Populus alba x Populus x berolinensis]|nr:pre-mRNA-processing factor 17 isoform X2 [Populus alba x Populus x berolinensis]
MDLLQNYQNDGELDQNPNSSPDSSPPRLLPSKSAAPKVDDTMLALTVANQMLSKPIDPVQHVVAFNPNYDQMWAPVLGPAHPYAKDGIAQGMRNHKLGFVEDAAIDSFVFDEQYNTFHKYGYAADPSASAGNNYIGDLDVLEKNNGISVFNIPQHEQKKRKIEKKTEAVEDDDDGMDKEEVENPATDAWLMKNRKSPWAEKYAEEHARKKEEKAGGEKGELVADKTTFHGKEERDYQGRSWIAPPKDAKASNDHCYIPKRLVHTWSGHTKGVSAIRFFPKHGHLILSAGMDTKVKIWDVFNSGKCMRTYMGHSKAVRDISFCNDGSKFLTAGYDKNIKYWDTETGQVISSFSTGKIPYVVKLNPDDDKQNILLAGDLLLHIVAGYACQVNFSPDGRFVMSGDGEGKCWFWDWKSCKVFRTLKCHEGVCIGAEWHPLEQSKVATCGWDGLIKYWILMKMPPPAESFNLWHSVSVEGSCSEVLDWPYLLITSSPANESAFRIIPIY